MLLFVQIYDVLLEYYIIIAFKMTDEVTKHSLEFFNI